LLELDMDKLNLNDEEEDVEYDEGYDLDEEQQ
jgi:hypothetical protein